MRLIALAAALMLAGLPALAWSQPAADAVAAPAPDAGKALNGALERLAKDPRDVAALLDAGKAALTLGDNEAALGFFSRADQIAPRDATVKAAVAKARLQLDDPVEALRWFGEAHSAGGNPLDFALDRGLAYDLVGANAAAIVQYHWVRDHGNDPAARDEAARREALSLAIGGDAAGAQAVLAPLLRQQDRAAWRTQIFVLAITGHADDAASVARTTMPPAMAEAITPYLRFMTRLTPAQQAGVVSLGRFPRAADIGRDDPRVIAYAAAHPRAALVPAPVLAAATAPPVAAKAARARGQHGHDTVAMALPVAPPVAMPPPPAPLPPPPAPVYSAVVPRPAVLSRLDLPPTSRAPRAAPMPAIVPDKIVLEKAAPVSTARAVKAGEKATVAPAPSTRNRRADRAKGDADKTALDLCPPVPAAKTDKRSTAKGHKAPVTRHGKAARHEAPPVTVARHGSATRHGKSAASALVICPALARADRPDAPAAVSRDSKGKGKANDKDANDKDANDKAKDKAKAKSAAKDKAGAKAGRAAARHASRIWVQVLTGADRDKMPAEWRAMVRKSHTLKGRKPYLSAWRSNFRLLTGPFDSDAAAQAFVAALRKDGVSSYQWTSPAGQAVDSLALP